MNTDSTKNHGENDECFFCRTNTIHTEQQHEKILGDSTKKELTEIKFGNPKKDSREAYLKALDKIDDLEMFVILAQKIDKLSKQGRINDIRRTLVVSFVSLLESAKAEAHMQGWHAGRAAANNPEITYGYAGMSQPEIEDKLKAQQEKK